MPTLTALRGARHISQCVLARECGVTQAAVSNWEKGRKTPTARHLLKIAQVLRCRVDEIDLPGLDSYDWAAVK